MVEHIGGRVESGLDAPLALPEAARDIPKSLEADAVIAAAPPSADAGKPRYLRSLVMLIWLGVCAALLAKKNGVWSASAPLLMSETSARLPKSGMPISKHSEETGLSTFQEGSPEPDVVEPDDSGEPGSTPADEKRETLSPPDKLDAKQQVTLNAPAVAVEEQGKPDTPLHAKLPDDDWGLPRVDEAETRLSPAPIRGKQFLASAIPQMEELDHSVSDTEADVLAAVTEAVTTGATKDLIGASICMEKITPFDESIKPSATSRTFKVTNCLGQGASSVVLEVFDETTGEKFALRVSFVGRLKLSAEQIAQLGRNASKLREESVRKACGPTPAALVASQKGIFAPMYTGIISGISDVFVSGKFYVFNEAELMERLQGDLNKLVTKLWRIPPEAKEYIAHRLLLVVLHLQQAGVSHSDLRFDNCFMRTDGSFSVGDFGVSAPFGTKMHDLSRLAPAYAEPQLLVDFCRFLRSEESVRPDPGSDIWSLGALLYEMFTDGKLPYGMSEIHNDVAAVHARATELLLDDVSPSELVPEMQRAEVPQRWQELLVKLLEPQRRKRITAREIAGSFPDLLGYPET